MKITNDFIGNETKALTKTKIATILRWWGFNPDSYSTWGNARSDMNNILSGTPTSEISDRERASVFLSKINYVNDTDAIIGDTIFAAGEQGVWYDPSDLSTLYQDAAGTTPVTAVEQPVGLMLDKSKGLVLGPELVTNGDFSNGTTGWSITAGNDATITTVSGEAVLTSGPSGIIASTPINTVVGKTYSVSSTARLGTFGGPLEFGVATTSTATPTNVLFTTTTSQTKTFVFTASSSTMYVSFRFPYVSPGATCYADNISVRELPGNHATQPTTTSRPVLSARVNLLTKTEDLNGGWTNQNCTLSTGITDPDGGTTAVGLIPNSGSNLYSGFYQAPNFASGLYVQQWLLKRGSKRYFWITTNGGSTKTFCDWDTLSGVSGNTVAFTPLTGGWYIVTATGTQGRDAGVYACDANNSITCVGDGATVAIYCCKPSLVPANHSSLPYQRVNTATDYDTTGFPMYLRCDGVDDGMVTNSINFTGTDKVTVCAGVRKLSDVTASLIAEHGVGGADVRAATMITSPRSNTNFEYRSQIRDGTYVTESTSISRPAPNTATHIHQLDYAKPWAEKVKYMINGVAVTSVESGTGAATGNFGNYPLYLFRRGGTTIPFNGHFYGMVIVGRLLSASELQRTEKYINGLTKAY